MWRWGTRLTKAQSAGSRLCSVVSGHVTRTVGTWAQLRLLAARNRLNREWVSVYHVFFRKWPLKVHLKWLGAVAGNHLWQRCGLRILPCKVTRVLHRWEPMYEQRLSKRHQCQHCSRASCRKSHGDNEKVIIACPAQTSWRPYTTVL